MADAPVPQPVPARAGIVLASGSPRRRELLAQLGLQLTIVSPDVDESPLAGEAPVPYVRRLAIAKAHAVAAAPDVVVVAADTTVDLDGEILAKPADADDARRMLRRLSGATHQVHTGVALRLGERTVAETVTTSVTFAVLSDAVVDWYVGTGEPMDKAGAYAVQGAGGALVERVDGSVSNVVGLPLHAVVRLADALGVTLLG